jgi:hypothetical protein
MNIIFFDLEFNKYQEVLSAGYIETNGLKIYNIKEFFFKNKTDNHTYKIHGLSNSFLQKYGKDKKEINSFKNTLLSKDYIIGFSITNDFKALNIREGSLYKTRKLIDLNLFFSLFNIKASLETIVKSLNLNIKTQPFFPIHTSIMDSLMVYTVIEYLFRYNKDISLNIFLEDLADISYIKYHNDTWEFEKYLEKYNHFKELFKELNFIKDKTIQSVYKYIEYDENIEIIDQNYNIIAKYKKKDKDIENTIKIVKNNNFGYKELIGDKNGR